MPYGSWSNHTSPNAGRFFLQHMVNNKHFLMPKRLALLQFSVNLSTRQQKCQNNQLVQPKLTFNHVPFPIEFCSLLDIKIFRLNQKSLGYIWGHMTGWIVVKIPFNTLEYFILKRGIALCRAITLLLNFSFSVTEKLLRMELLSFAHIP